jgi:hypothetical protein
MLVCSDELLAEGVQLLHFGGLVLGWRRVRGFLGIEDVVYCIKL